MNYNNKRKPTQAKPSENMMMLDRSKNKLPSGRSSLCSVLLVGLLAGAVPLSAIAAPAAPNTSSGGTASDASRKALEAANQKSEDDAAKVKAEAAKAKAEAEAKTKAAEEKAAFWQKIRTTALWLLALLLGLGFFYLLISIRLSKKLDEKIDDLKRHSDKNTRALVSESAKKQAKQLKDAFAEMAELRQQIQQLRQLQPVSSGGRQREAGMDYPTLQPVAPVIPPPQSIDEEDRLALQQAFLEWRANSRSKKMTDCLPSSFLQKIKALEYEIVFAKAGVGLERMIIDRKPPSSTRMVGLTSHSHSIMYCYEHTYQGDELWTPNTWYEVSIDPPDSADEQSVNQLGDVPA